jgi:hypothetical protein
MTTTAIETGPITSLDDLNRVIVLPVPVLERWLQRFDWTHHQLARNEFPMGFRNLRDFQLACLIADPVLWVPFFLREPDDPDHLDPYGLWDYQRGALRHRSHKVYYCAAEVGKTRDIVADSFYMGFTTPNGSGLIGAPQQTHLEEIIEAMHDQMRWNPILMSMLTRWKKHPHHAFYFANEFKVDFRPAGHDGEAFRGVHAKTFAKLDEAAKMSNPKQWSEFWRAVKPDCKVGVYSVPDGRRDTDFYKLGQRAKSNKKEDLELESFKDAGSHVKDFKFKYVHWSKELMPPPFWSRDRKRFYIEQFNGEDSQGYKHNVLGIDGDPAYSVFPWHHLKHCVRVIDDYRCLKVLVNSAMEEVSVERYSCELVPGEDGPVPRKVSMMDTAYSLASFFDYDEHGETEFRRLIKSFFVAVPGLKIGGADFGFSADPTEIIVRLVIGHQERVVARLQLKHVTYDQQCQALDAMDDVYGASDTLWGTDFGNAGSAVTHILQGEPRYEHKDYAGRLQGFMFEGVTDNVNAEGEPLIDAKTGKPARITMKELATDIMTTKMQRQRMELPPDPDITTHMTGHTCRASGKHRIYDKSNDHFIDACRVSELARILGAVVEDSFACGN